MKLLHGDLRPDTGGIEVAPNLKIARLAQEVPVGDDHTVFDEVITGFGRLGAPFGADYFGVTPDIITTAKGIAGGLPLAAVTGRADVMDSVHAGGLGGTYGGNPIACAAALGSIETMRSQDLCGRAKEIEAIFMSRLEQLRNKYDVIADVRGRGAMLAIELTVGADDLTPNPTVTAAINSYCHSQGLVTLTAGTFGNVFRTSEWRAIDRGHKSTTRGSHANDLCRGRYVGQRAA